MNRLKYEGIISSTNTTQQDIQSLVNTTLSAPIASMFDLFLYLFHSLESPVEPHTQFNAILTLMTLVRKGRYPQVNLVDHIFLDLLKEPAQVASSKSQNKVYDYFESKGFRAGDGSLQSLSYHFTHCCMEVCLMVAYIKPKRFYKNKECSAPSRAKLLERDLIDKGITEQICRNVQTKYDFLSLKKQFVRNTIEFHKSPNHYIDFFMKQMEYYLTSQSKNTYFQWYKTLCKEGEVYLSSESLARQVEVICFHKNFSVRKNALQLVMDFIFWGDLEALLLINFTDYLGIIGDRVLQAQKKFNKTGIFCIFPQIDGQNRQKQGFLNEYLLCIKRIAIMFPSLDSYFVDSGQSPIYQLYIQLLEKHIVFPVWEGQEQSQSKIHNNFRNKKEFNNFFLEELGKQKIDLGGQCNPLKPTTMQMFNFCQKNRQNFKVFQKTLDLHSTEWDQLVDFRKHFQEYLQRMAIEGNDSEIETLIEDGIQLQESIQQIQKLVIRLKNGTLTQQQFKRLVQKSSHPKRNDYQDKLSNLKQSIRSRGKQSLRYSLSPSSEAVKDKLSVKILKLAQKRSQPVEQISRLELHSRPFLANQIHGKGIINQFVPILHLHPLRKDKRSRGGLKIVSGEKEKQESQKDSQKERSSQTPKFKSVIMSNSIVNSLSGGRSSTGTRGQTQKLGSYQKYLKYLDQKRNLEYLKQNPLKIVDNQLITIERSSLYRFENKLQTTFTCRCKINHISKLQIKISEQPSLEIKRNQTKISQKELQLKLTAKFIKFGYSLPEIIFILDQQLIKQVPLPFVFHNFLTITPAKHISDVFSQKWPIQYPLRDKIRLSPEEILLYLKGLTLKKNELSGQISFAQWQCNILLVLDNTTLSIQIQSKDDESGNVLTEMLPIICSKLFTQWRNNHF